MGRVDLCLCLLLLAAAASALSDPMLGGLYFTPVGTHEDAKEQMSYVTVDSCRDMLSCSSGCSRTAVPLDYCTGRTTYTCDKPVMQSMCVSATLFSDSNCSAPAMTGSSVCGTCNYDSDAHSSWRITCGDEVVVEYDCLPGCSSCRSRLPVSVGMCSPISYWTHIQALRPTSKPFPCSTVTIKRFIDDSCTALNYSMQLPESVCDSGSRFTCPAPQSVVVKNCPFDKLKCATGCSYNILPEATCFSDGSMARCPTPDSPPQKCTDLIIYTSLSCSPENTALAAQSLICGNCYSTDNNGYMGVACSGNTTVLSTGCRSDCTSCNETVYVSAGKCAAIHLPQYVGIMAVANPRSCSILKVEKYSDSKCSRLNHTNLAPLDSCMSGQSLSCAAVPPSTPAPAKVFYFAQCADKMRCDGNCTYQTLPQDTCMGRQKFHCDEAVAQCPSATLYADASCSTAVESSSVVCGACNLNDRGGAFWRLNCMSSGDMVLLYNCSRGCANCQGSRSLKVGVCTPIDFFEGLHAIKPTQPAMPCNTLSVARYSDYDCTVFNYSVIAPADKCLAGARFTCPAAPNTLSVRRCTDKLFCSKDCISYNMPANQCLGGTRLQCPARPATDAKCVDFRVFDGTTCASSNATLSQTLPCGGCVMTPGGYVQLACEAFGFGVHMGCDSQCARCSSYVPLAVMRCAALPVMVPPMSATPLGVPHDCSTLTYTKYNEYGCNTVNMSMPIVQRYCLSGSTYTCNY